MNRILLLGNPNVGKSALFSRLTGIHVITSNYAGTTIQYKKGNMKWEGRKVEVIDVPGTYTLKPTNAAEEVALGMLRDEEENGDGIILNVVDATNLERNLNLTLQLLKRNIPLLIVLNFWDEAAHKGISINAKKMEEILGIPVATTCAVTGEGVNELMGKLKDAKKSSYEYDYTQKWQQVGKIVDDVQCVTHRHHTMWENLGDLTIQPLTGIPIAAAILFLTFEITRFFGESLTNFIFDPLFKTIYLPFISRLFASFPEFLSVLLLGKTPDPLDSFGILSTGIYIPFVIVLPYLFSFYLVLSFLEDWGYLPRLAVLSDTIYHRLGLHGYSMIPCILGLGCKVPAILSTRILETERERIIASTLILMAAPCLPQTAMVISIMSPYGGKYLVLIFGTILAISVFSTYLLNSLLKGETPELFVEIPPYRIPRLSVLFNKLYMRLCSFISEAIPLIMLGVAILSLIDSFGITQSASNFLGKPLLYILGLPPQVLPVVVTGFLRKDVSIALLRPFFLPPEQLAVACIFLILYSPCISTVFVMIKELGVKKALQIIGIMLTMSLSVGGVLNLLFRIL